MCIYIYMLFITCCVSYINPGNILSDTQSPSGAFREYICYTQIGCWESEPYAGERYAIYIYIQMHLMAYSIKQKYIFLSYSRICKGYVANKMKMKIGLSRKTCFCVIFLLLCVFCFWSKPDIAYQRSHFTSASFTKSMYSTHTHTDCVRMIFIRIFIFISATHIYIYI